MNETYLTVRISTRYYNICIHKKTLQAIGNPAFIHLGYDPRTKSLMVLGTWAKEEKAVRVRYDSSGSFYVYSKGLIEGIRSVSNVLIDDGSYLVKGLLADGVPAIAFALSDAKIEATEED